MVSNIDQELENLVEILVDEIPLLKEVRLFGSYIRDDWNPDRSDVDVFVLIGDEDYCSEKDKERGFNYTFVESKLRRELRGRIKNRLDSKYADRFSLFLCTPDDVLRLSKVNLDRGNLGENMINGRLIYPLI
jgi:predicted nucleotidyltransferase